MIFSDRQESQYILLTKIEFAKRLYFCGMKLIKVSNTSDNIVARLFPKFGSRALDIPTWDEGKRMYLVDQHQSASGNRSLIYVGISDQLLIEMTLGHFHSWEFVNKVRAMIYDGMSLRVIATYEWPQSTHFNIDLVREKVQEILVSYVLSLGQESGLTHDQAEVEIKKLVSNLLSADVHNLDNQNLRKVLEHYCEAQCICSDFTGQEYLITI